jgi:hypothetical protein
MTPDIVNGIFEAIGGLMIINNCRVILRDKAVAGVSVLTTAFFSAWGMWNLFYCPHLGQWCSFAGGLLIVSANCVWISLALKYRGRQDPARADALEALEDMDDFARMANIDPYGPYAVLRNYIMGWR